jgi:hypothetical protein
VKQVFGESERREAILTLGIKMKAGEVFSDNRVKLSHDTRPFQLRFRLSYLDRGRKNGTHLFPADSWIGAPHADCNPSVWRFRRTVAMNSTAGIAVTSDHDRESSRLADDRLVSFLKRAGGSLSRTARLGVYALLV